MIHWQTWRILWLGDAGRLSEQKLLEYNIDLKADLIVAGLHQSDYSLTKPFIDAVAPQAIIIPASPAAKWTAPASNKSNAYATHPSKSSTANKPAG